MDYNGFRINKYYIKCNSKRKPKGRFELPTYDLQDHCSTELSYFGIGVHGRIRTCEELPQWVLSPSHLTTLIHAQITLEVSLILT